MVVTRRKRIKAEDESERPSTNASSMDEDPISRSPIAKDARKRPRHGSKEQFTEDQAVEQEKSPVTRTRKRQRGVNPGTADHHSDADNQHDDDGDASASHSEGEAEDNSVNADDKSDEPKETTRSGRKRKRSQKGPKGRGAVADRTCVHCGKVIVSIHGLKYHVGTCFACTCGSAVSVSNQLTAFDLFPT